MSARSSEDGGSVVRFGFTRQWPLFIAVKDVQGHSTSMPVEKTKSSFEVKKKLTEIDRDLRILECSQCKIVCPAAVGRRREYVCWALVAAVYTRHGALLVPGSGFSPVQSRFATATLSRVRITPSTMSST